MHSDKFFRQFEVEIIKGVFCHISLSLNHLDLSARYLLSPYENFSILISEK
jgi:hypothetical protein